MSQAAEPSLLAHVAGPTDRSVFAFALMGGDQAVVRVLCQALNLPFENVEQFLSKDIDRLLLSTAHNFSQQEPGTLLATPGLNFQTANFLRLTPFEIALGMKNFPFLRALVRLSEFVVPPYCKEIAVRAEPDATSPMGNWLDYYSILELLWPENTAHLIEIPTSWVTPDNLAKLPNEQRKQLFKFLGERINDRYNGKTLLQRTIDAGQLRVFKSLCKQKQIDLNAPFNSNLERAIHYLARKAGRANENKERLQCLRAVCSEYAKLDLNAVTSDNQTAIQIAQSTDNGNAFAILLSLPGMKVPLSIIDGMVDHIRRSQFGSEIKLAHAANSLPKVLSRFLHRSPELLTKELLAGELSKCRVLGIRDLEYGNKKQYTEFLYRQLLQHPVTDPRLISLTIDDFDFISEHDTRVKNIFLDSLEKFAAAGAQIDIDIDEWPDWISSVEVESAIQKGRKVFLALFTAAKNGDSVALYDYMKAGYSLNIKDKEGNTPLHLGEFTLAM